MNNPKTTILTAMLATGGLITWRMVQAEAKVTPTTYGALVVITLFLLVLSGFAEDLAAAFAVLVFVVVLLGGAGESLGTLSRLGGRG